MPYDRYGDWYEEEVYVPRRKPRRRSRRRAAPRWRKAAGLLEQASIWLVILVMGLIFLAVFVPAFESAIMAGR